MGNLAFGTGASFSITRDGRHLLTQNLPAGRRAFIHPISAPDGYGILTEDLPGHHPWQRGLYAGFNLVNGIGFWREQPGDGSFNARLIDGPTSIGDTASWTVQSDWSHPADGSLMLTETQAWRFTPGETSYVIDLDWSLKAAIDIEIGQFMAGGLFLRMPYAPNRGARAVNSDGLENQDAETRRARWVAVEMPLIGRPDSAGIAIMDHPDNPAHPTTWRVDGEFGISPSRVIAGPWQIPQQNTERYRYRLFVFCGSLVKDDVEASWDSFISVRED